MKLSVALHSLSYVITLCSSMVLIKVFNYFYGYNDYMFTVALYSIFAPLNFIPFLYTSWSTKLDSKIWRSFFIPAVLYSGENILLSFTLNNMELGLYIIARTSYSIFNYFSYRYILHRKLNNYYYIGVALLLLSYVFIMLDFSKHKSQTGMVMFCLCIATGGSTSIYNTLAELQLSRIKEDKMAYTLCNNVIFQMTAFCINLPIALPQIQSMMYQPSFIVLTILAALGFQVYSTNKFFILNDPDVNGSMIISSLDLLRRIIINTVSYTALKEPITLYNMIGNGLLLVASVSLFISSNGKTAGEGSKTVPTHEDDPALEHKREDERDDEEHHTGRVVPMDVELHAVEREDHGQEAGNGSGKGNARHINAMRSMWIR